MIPPATRIAAAAASTLLAIAALTACAPDGPPGGGVMTFTPTPSESESTSTPTPTPTPTASAEIPDDCEALLNKDVLAQLDNVPLNDPAFGESGPQPDGSLVCIWGDPRADTTRLMTTIAYMSRGPALDMLNELADDEDFTCYTPDGGTRCEKTWENETYPVTDGRTLFWRDDILIDTRFSNLAPTGYTTAIIESIWSDDEADDEG